MTDTRKNLNLDEKMTLINALRLYIDDLSLERGMKTSHQIKTETLLEEALYATRITFTRDRE